MVEGSVARIGLRTRPRLRRFRCPACPSVESDSPTLLFTTAQDRGRITMLSEYLESWSAYRQARKELLTVVGIAESQRDPMSEFSERVALIVLGGELPESRVQPGFDLTRETSATVQVKYLANPMDRWINEHTVEFKSADVPDEYALLIFEDVLPQHLIVFKRA